MSVKKVKVPKEEKLRESASSIADIANAEKIANMIADHHESERVKLKMKQQGSYRSISRSFKEFHTQV